MEERRRQLYGLISRLLDYPDEDILNSVADIEQSTEKLPGGSRELLLDFLSYIRKTPLITVQEEYTRAFDLNPSLCLNLTFHKWGDDRKRSTALVELKKMYTDAGYEIHGGELPDFLPMVLEFMSVRPEDPCLQLYDAYGDQVALIASRLRDQQSPYAGLFEVLDSAWRRQPI